jgi:hypothetical protein
MNWLTNDLSAEGASSLGGSDYARWKILKLRTLEIPFPAIWALNYELQFDFKKGKTLEIMLYF